MLSISEQITAAFAAPLASVRVPGNEEPLLHFWLPFGFLGVIAWGVWIARRVLTSFYRPAKNDFTSPTTVVAPAFREDPEILVAAIRSWLVAGADEIVMVFPDDEAHVMRAVESSVGWNPRIWYHTTDNPAKRNSLKVGILAASNPIVVLSDSDTLWEPDCLKNLLMPFADPTVGGVGTRQRVW
ncbi:MAG: glycosyltransferase, partial [Solirubrobacterales bacterium]